MTQTPPSSDPAPETLEADAGKTPAEAAEVKAPEPQPEAKAAPEGPAAAEQPATSAPEPEQPAAAAPAAEQPAAAPQAAQPSEEQPAPAAPDGPAAAEQPATSTPDTPATQQPAADGQPSAPAQQRPQRQGQRPGGQGQGQGQGRPDRPRRRRPTAAERHRRTFFAKLSELRRNETAALEGEEPEPTTAPAADGADAQPVADGAAEGQAPAADGTEQPSAEQQPPAPQQPQAAAPPATSPSRSARAQARLVAAIDRVGGAEAVLAALEPKTRDDGETMKWSAVCAEQAQGIPTGDPTFSAWVRLAGTPVRDVKAIVNPRQRDDRGRGRGGRSGGGGGGGRGRGRRDNPWDTGGSRAGRGDVEAHGRDGAFRSSVRIIGLDQLKDAIGTEEPKGEDGDASKPADDLAGRSSS